MIIFLLGLLFWSFALCNLMFGEYIFSPVSLVQVALTERVSDY